IPDNNPAGVSSSLTVPTATGPGHITHLSVSLDVGHARDSDLEADLVGPDGTTVTLFHGVGDGGANFGDVTTDTTLDDSAATPVHAGQLVFSYVDTQSAARSRLNDPLGSNDSTLAVLGADGATVLGSADNGGPGGVSAADVADAKKHLTGSGLGGLADGVTTG